MNTQNNSLSRLLGAILLIAGTTIGAAMLALPVSCGRGGLIPSLATMLFCWLFLVMAALYLLEVNLTEGLRGTNLISMASSTLGIYGKVLGWCSYLFLLYALNTAYISVTTFLFQDLFSKYLGVSLPQLICILPLLVVFGIILRSGMHVIDLINRILMFGLALSFVILIAACVPHIRQENLASIDWTYVLPSLSVAVTAFGFHIVIPSLVTYLHGNVKALKASIWLGSFIPFLVYAIWLIATIGIVPLKGEWSIESAYATGKNGAQILAAMTDSPFIASLAESFIFFPVITSFLGVSLSLFDFLADGLKIDKHHSGKWKLFFFAFIPPLYFALTDPHIFFTALEYAGAFGVVILLALIPALMVWRKRYDLRLHSPYQAPGGKVALLSFMALCVCFVVIEVLIKIGY